MAELTEATDEVTTVEHAEFFARLAEPFRDNEIRSFSRSGKTFDYVTARAVIENSAAIVELPGYCFDSSGSTWSRWVRGSKNHRLGETWHLIRPRRNCRRDYLYVTLRKADGKRGHFRVNVLILWAFTGSRPDGLEAAHKDGNRTNNRLENLEWKTHAENIRDKHVHGTMRRGTSIPSAKLSPADVVLIRSLLGSSSCSAIGRRFSVSQTTIRMIARGETWNHVEKDA